MAGNPRDKLVVQCQNCGKKFKASARLAGKSLPCTQCKTPIAIQGIETGAPPSAPSHVEPEIITTMPVTDVSASEPVRLPQRTRGSRAEAEASEAQLPSAAQAVIAAGIQWGFWGLIVGFGLGLYLVISGAGEDLLKKVLILIFLPPAGGLAAASLKWGAIAGQTSGGSQLVDGLIRVVSFPFYVIEMMFAMILGGRGLGIAELMTSINRIIFGYASLVIAGVPYALYVMLSRRTQVNAPGFLLLNALGFIPALLGLALFGWLVLPPLPEGGDMLVKKDDSIKSSPAVSETKRESKQETPVVTPAGGEAIKRDSSKEASRLKGRRTKPEAEGPREKTAPAPTVEESEPLAKKSDSSPTSRKAPSRAERRKETKQAPSREKDVKWKKDPDAPTIEGFAYLHDETFSCGGRSKEVKIYLHAKTGLEFVLLEGGQYMKGSPDDEEGRNENERYYQCRVKPFLICRTECTQEAWDKIGGTDNRKWSGPSLPIESVSWSDCTKWCKSAGLRLPNEAEWEYACRAGSSNRFCYGSHESGLKNHSWFRSNSSSRTHPVAQKEPNAFGLYDLHGNVWEWCQNKYFKDRVTRGGGWNSTPPACRCAKRFHAKPKDRLELLGFRPVCDADI